MLQKVDTTEILLCAMMYKVSDKDLLRPFFKIGAMKLACSVVEGRHTMKISCPQCYKRPRYMIKFVTRSVAEGSRHTNCLCKMSQKVDIRRNRPPIPSCHKALFQSEAVYM